MPVKDTIQSRRGSSAQWSAANPILAEGEIGYDSTTKQIKVGDGVTNWNALAYSTPVVSSVAYTSQTLTDGQKQQARINIGWIDISLDGGNASSIYDAIDGGTA